MSGPQPGSHKRTITVHELLERSARAALDLQREDGSFPPGQNGVYDEPETPVRTTSHWLTTLSKVYALTGERVFADAASDAADYLLGDDARPHGNTFYSRTVADKDACDGVIGQAAPIRGLSLAGRILDREELYKTAEEVFFLHPFDRRLGLWERVEIDGERLSFDRTVNHQLTFAAAGAELLRSVETVRDPLETFLDQLEKNMTQRKNGVIRHYINPPVSKVIRTVLGQPRHWPLLWNILAFGYHSFSEERRRKEIGYLPVVVSSLARLHREFPDHELWQRGSIDTAVEYLTSRDSDGAYRIRTAASGSMLPGIEAGYGLFVFGYMDPCRDLIAADISEHFDAERGLLDRNATDPISQSSKIYNLALFPDPQFTIRL